MHLAKMLKEGGNLILLGEPTNDLDVETLSSLEDFPGGAVVISHDRFFLDRIATHILAFEGDGHVEWFEGNFQAYEEDKAAASAPPRSTRRRRSSRVSRGGEIERYLIFINGGATIPENARLVHTSSNRRRSKGNWATEHIGNLHIEKLREGVYLATSG